MELPVYNQQGEKVRTLTVNPEIFGVKVKPHVLQEAVVTQQARARQGSAHTKTRGEVRGGGKKPWKQKGTGRARVGSIRSPLWRGGGIVFGPRAERNYAKKINRKVRQAALKMALSDKFSSSALWVVEGNRELALKTKILASLLKALNLKRGRTLLALAPAERDWGRAAINLPSVTVLSAQSLNVVDLLKHINLVTTPAGVQEIEKFYGRKLHRKPAP